MTFVTKLTFQSGDRAVLDDLVSDLKRKVERKGAECKGPHSSPPEHVRAPQYRTLSPGGEYSSWEYTIYSRKLEIHGNEPVARHIVQGEFPDSVHVEIEVDQKKPLGHRQR